MYKRQLSDDALMDTVQRRTFQYFWEGGEPYSGCLLYTSNKTVVSFDNLQEITPVVTGIVLHKHNPTGYSFDVNAGSVSYTHLDVYKRQEYV